MINLYFIEFECFCSCLRSLRPKSMSLGALPLCHSESPFGRLCPERVLTSNECEKSSSAQPATTLKDLSGLKAVRDDKLWVVVRDDTIFCVTPSETFFQFFPRNLVSLVGSFVCRQTSTLFLNHAVLTIISIIRAPALPSQN